MATPQQKKQWKEAAIQQQIVVSTMLKDIAESYVANPDSIGELLAFGSKFYKYSINNTMLIHGQNPYATYVASYCEWQKMGASINQGEKGIKVFVPINKTFLSIAENLIPYEKATQEQIEMYKRGEVQIKRELTFKIGNVFDISQTDYPKSHLPQLYSMGYNCEKHALMYEGLVEYANSINCPVKICSLGSIALRGNYMPSRNCININEMLDDSEKFSVLSHELSHAILHNSAAKSSDKSKSQMEFEADALSIMIQSYFDIELTDSRKAHLSRAFSEFTSELEAKYGKDKVKMINIVNPVYAKYRGCIRDISNIMERKIPEISIKSSNETFKRDMMQQKENGDMINELER